MTTSPSPSSPPPLEPLSAFDQWRTRLRYGGSFARAAWKRAIHDEALALRLARAGIEVPCTSSGRSKASSDPLNVRWCDALHPGRYGILDFGERPPSPTQVQAWMRSLPETELGQLWRDRALWTALRAESSAPGLLECVVAAGGNVHRAEVDWNDPLVVPCHNPLEWLLRKGSFAIAERAKLLVAQGLRVDDTVRQMDAPLQRMDLADLKALHALGMTVDDPALAARWLQPYVRHPVLHPATKLSETSAKTSMVCCAFLLDIGADPNVRNDEGLTPLMEVLATQDTWRSSAPNQALEDWFDFWVARGADLTARLPNGMTLVHLVLAPLMLGQNSNARPSPAILRALGEANPGALDIPFPAEYLAAGPNGTPVSGHTPRILLTHRFLRLASSPGGGAKEGSALLEALRNALVASDLAQVLNDAAPAPTTEATAPARRPRL